jgi:hypothetical protein
MDTTAATRNVARPRQDVTTGFNMTWSFHVTKCSKRVRLTTLRTEAA